MTLRILCFALLLPLAGRAQFAPFPTPGLEYGAIYVCNMYDCPTYLNSSIRYVGDTVLCGYTWNKFASLPGLPPFGYYTYLRAEQGRYYALFGSCANQRLYYDFSKNAGDTVVTDDLGPLLVTEVGAIMLDNGEIRKKMILQDFNPVFTSTYTWVDGIGDINRAFFRASDFEGGHGQLICQRDSSGVLYQNPAPTYILNCDSLLCPWPKPAFEYSCTDGTFQFVNLSREADHYIWDFGDGTSSTEEHPTHAFSGPGCYQVTLRAKAFCLPEEDFTVHRWISVDVPVFWKPAVPQPPVYFDRFQFVDDQHGWAYRDSTLWKTANGGLQWDSVPYPGPKRRINNLQFKDFEHGLVSIRIPSSPYYSEILWTNDGSNWSVHPLTNHPSITAIERVNDSVAVVAAHYHGIFATRNGGQSWTNIPHPGLMSLIMDFVSVGGDTVYFIGENQYPGFPNPFGFGRSANALNWQVDSLPPLTGWQEMDFADARHGWVSNGTGILYTANGGQSWTLQPSSPAVINEIECIDSLHVWASGPFSGVYFTDDGGQHWQQQACPLTENQLRNLSAVSLTQAYVLTRDSLYEFTLQPDTAHNCVFTTSLLQPGSPPAMLPQITPNPASTYLEITWPDQPVAGLELVLFNGFGVEVMRWRANAGERVSIAHLPAGFYLLQGIVPEKIRIGGKKLIICR